MSAPLPRRRLLQTLAGFPLATALAGWARAAAADAGLVTSQVCTVSPQTTEGPYYFDPNLVRRDITEGRPGLPMDLTLQIVTSSCAPIPGARVDIWHCDAAGSYSGYSRENTSGETFLRGTQVADANGVVKFRSIFPGWYPGRTAHVHLMVYLSAREMLTSQLFFPDSFVEDVFWTTEPYAAHGPQDTPLFQDGIARRAGDGAIAEVTRQGDTVRAAMVLGLAA